MHLFLAILFALSGTETSTSMVSAIYPSGTTISANTLRISILFNAPVRGEVLHRLTLLDQRDHVIRDPFLEQELWSPDRRQLTVLFDPGRLKSGVGKHEDMGPPLAGSTFVRLLLDGVAVKTWKVDATRCRPLFPGDWKLTEPTSGSRAPVELRFPEAVDIQSQHLIAVVDSEGKRVPGSESLADFERTWIFRPQVAWDKAGYSVIVHPDFENPCGDEIGETFEHSALDETAPVRRLWFTIQR